MQPNIMQLMQFAKAAAPQTQGAPAGMPRPQMPMPGGMPPGAPPGMGAGPPPNAMPPGMPGMPSAGPATLATPPSGQSGSLTKPPMPNPLAAKIGSVIKPVGMAAKGRGGDTMMAHMTPGEIAVPPQVQTPDVLAALNKAFSQAGANPTSYQAGSPDQKVNPQTGQPEFGFFDMLLPTALGIAGSAFLGPEVLAPMLGLEGATGLAGAIPGALGGFAGTTAGNLLTGQGLMPSLAGGAAAGAGSALAGSLMGGGAMGRTPTGAGPDALTAAQAAAGQTGPLGGEYGGGSDTGNQSSFLDKALAQLKQLGPQALGIAGGNMLGQSFFPSNTAVPANVNGPAMTPMSQLPPLSNFIGGGSGNSGTAIPFGAQRRPPIGYRPGIDPQFGYFG